MLKPSQSVRSKNGPLQCVKPPSDEAARSVGSSDGLAQSLVAAKDIHIIDTGDAKFVCLFAEIRSGRIQDVAEQAQPLSRLRIAFGRFPKVYLGTGNEWALDHNLLALKAVAERRGGTR